MSEDQDEVSRLIQRTRANRERLNRHLNDFGEAPHPIRSPLREKNVVTTTTTTTSSSNGSPAKIVRTSTFTKSPSSSKDSPIRIRRLAEESPSKEFDEIPDNSSKETFNREVTETKTTIEDSPVREGDRERYTKTTITEKEETIHKTEHVKFTELVGPLGQTVTSTSGMPNTIRERIKEMTRSTSRDEKANNVVQPSATTFAGKRKGISPPSSPVRNRSPSPKRMTTAAAAATTTTSAKKPSSGATPIITSALRTYDYDEETFGPSGRKKRLADLAKKFHNYEEEDEEEEDEELAFIDDSRHEDRDDLNVTKEVDVDMEIAQQRKRSDDRRMPKLNKGPRVQDAEETAAVSKPKLVHDVSRQTILSSPTKTAAEPRPPSPHKPHPMQFISPQVNNALGRSSPARGGLASNSTAGGQRPASPSKQDAGRPSSPYKSHPLQFVSPHAAAPSVVAARVVPASEPRQFPPSKPARSWVMEVEEEQTAVAGPSYKTPKPPAKPPVTQPMSEPMTDTASRKSMAEKWSLFETQTTRKESPPPEIDPAMLSMSERRAMFDKNRSAPRPVARFGDAVTPSMLLRGQGRIEAPAQPKKLFAPMTRSQQQSPSRMKLSSPVRAADQQKKLQQAASPVPRPPSPPPKPRPRSPMRDSPKKMVLKNSWEQIQPRSPRENKRDQPDDDEKAYPGVNSLKRIKVSPPKPGQLYPQLIESSDEERPGTSMSMESAAPSEAPSLGSAIKRASTNDADFEAPSFGGAIKRAASAYRQMQDRRNAMPAISERSPGNDEDAEMTTESAEIDDMLDEALDDSYASSNHYRQHAEGPTPPKTLRMAGVSPTLTAASWEFQTPSGSKHQQKDFKTPLVAGMIQSPLGENLPEVEGEEGVKLMHSVSIYRKQTTNLTPVTKIVRKAEAITEKDERTPRENIQKEIRKLQEESEEQHQRMQQASKALNFCVSQDEFEGSSERVEGERLLLDATHKYMAATAEIRRLSTEGAIGRPDGSSSASSSKGSISISGLGLPLKGDFIRMLHAGGDDTVHYFVVLIKYRSRVISTQMLSTIDGINRGKLVFPNLINLRDLDLDFQIHVEVYGLQTRKEHIAHDVKYHIRKEKSVFNLTPLKKLKKQESSAFPRNQNPVNSKTIRRPAFGMVGFAVINVQTLKNRAFQLDRVPQMSPLEGGMEMTLTIHSESKIEQRGFLTMFTDVNGYGDWCRRWCRLSGNALHFWKYPEDETKVEPSEQVLLSICETGDVTLAPRDICSRMNTFMLETKRPWRQGDSNSLVMHVNGKTGMTTLRHLLSADTREERIGWCSILNRALENNRAWDPSAFRARSDSMGSRSSFDSTSTASGAVASSAVSSSSTEIW